MKTCFQPNGLVRSILWVAALCAPIAAQAAPPVATAQRPPASAAKQIERGRYLLLVGGCNDCHTPGYGPSGGKVAEQDWLVGDKLGFSGPWGTTYPSNLRLLVAGMTEPQWLVLAGQAEMRPPMPWVSLHAMQQDDLKAIYRYIAWLGPKGEPAPAYLPPGSVPRGPVVVFPAAPAQ
jgi:mono/diheme cytochrome c family protein